MTFKKGVSSWNTGGTSWNKGKKNWNSGKKGCFTKEQLQRRTETRRKNAEARGYYWTEETQRKRSESQRGSKSPRYGKKGILCPNYGPTSPSWKGGPRFSNIRHYNKRRRLGYKTLNPYFDGSAPHHINTDEILFIPRWLHDGIKHSVTNPKRYKFGIDRINIAAWLWYLFDSTYC